MVFVEPVRFFDSAYQQMSVYRSFEYLLRYGNQYLTGQTQQWYWLIYKLERINEIGRFGSEHLLDGLLASQSFIF